MIAEIGDILRFSIGDTWTIYEQKVNGMFMIGRYKPFTPRLYLTNRRYYNHNWEKLL
jgi:hypothetical protein